MRGKAASRIDHSNEREPRRRRKDLWRSLPWDDSPTGRSACLPRRIHHGIRIGSAHYFCSYFFVVRRIISPIERENLPSGMNLTYSL